MTNDTKTPARHWSKEIPDARWDAIVIGSGMGGMTTAALLAKVGRRVLVLEQHYEPGGFTHTFQRKGWRWDVGVHAVGEVSLRSRIGRVLHLLTDGQLEWASLGPVYDSFEFPEGLAIEFPDSPEKFRANLVAAFPDDAAAIDAYLAEVRRVARAMPGHYGALTASGWLGSLAQRLIGKEARVELERRTAEVLAALTPNPKLRAVLAAQWGYYGSVPSRSSFAIQALVAKHFWHGAYYPVGGAQRIAEALLGVVERAGGAVAVRADVERVVVEHGRAVGVRTRDGRELRAPIVVSAVGVQSTVNRLLPEPLRSAPWAREVAAMPPAPAHVCLYLGFSGDIREAGASAANRWFYETWDHEAELWHVAPGADVPRAPCLYCSFPSLKDPTHDPGPDQLHTGEVVTFVPWDAFAGWEGTRWYKRGEDYEAFKAAMTERLLEQLYERMPKLRGLVKHAELSTPLSTDHFARPSRGSIYGLEPTVDRFKSRWLRPKSPIPGLYFSGSEVASVGVMGAMLGGLLCGAAIEPLRAVALLRDT
ncbi:MAG: NAD(P)/FAD-dependent oxidoreductase [Myxococcales bacterium]|nr:NAD(P)/FAD-dependent oxidoreductase [Myxococcales bacterium]MCB9519507.1 NAD(P)/FAD-dependent oxidoreductase [Myxococcales bacterium]MCB9533268.1 NAD(P)/FAD-dependent oxidoreductase [Myxococcales bacterium]